jgi:hypothetical protein
MAGTEKKTAKQPIMKGGSKGGTRFPRLKLGEALGYSKKLVSKTFNGPQPEVTVLVGVFNNKGPMGEVRASALKQYGLMEGDKEGYLASALAKKIEAVVPEERIHPIRTAFLMPRSFKLMYDTLQPDNVTRAKVRQAAATAKVHPESLDECVDNFINGAAYSGFGTKTDEGIDLSQSTLAPLPPPDEVEPEPDDEVNGENGSAVEKIPPPSGTAAEAGSTNGKTPNYEKAGRVLQAKPAITLSLTVDPTSDPEKLEKQLRLLRQFGVI